MNSLHIIGNLTADPETRTTSDGRDVCNFTVAVNRRKKTKGQPEADFFRVSAWNETGKNCQKYLSKGRKVSVVGPVTARAYTRNDGTVTASLEVMANDVEFLSSKNEGTGDNNGYTPVDDQDCPWG